MHHYRSLLDCNSVLTLALSKVNIVKVKKCVAYPQEDFLFIKLITSFRISLLNNCKKDFQFHIKTTERNFFYTKYKIFLHDLFEFHVYGLSVHFRPHKVYFFELSIKFLIDG
jgi:hypothetical protein